MKQQRAQLHTYSKDSNIEVSQSNPPLSICISGLIKEPKPKPKPKPITYQLDYSANLKL